MKKYLSVLSLIVCLNKIIAQNCPQGYEERVVKCNGEFIKKCIPINFSCNKCWHVEYSDCSGSIDRSIVGNHYNTYDECLKNATELQTNFKPSSGCPNKFKTFRITLTGSKDNLCAALDVNNNDNSNQNKNKNPANTGANNNLNQSNNNNSTNKGANNNQTGIINKPFPGAKRDLQLQADFEFFYVQHHNAEEKLEEIKKKYPNNATLYENNYRPKLLQLLINVKNEDAKDNPSPQTIKGFGKQLDNLIEQMESAETMALNNSNAQNTQKQQYQTQADEYLNKAQDKNQSSISNQLNLDLAKTNAIMSGNQSQVQQIEKIQNNVQQQRQQEMSNNAIQLGSAVVNLINVIGSENREKREGINAMLFKWKQGFVYQYANELGNFYQSKYPKYIFKWPKSWTSKETDNSAFINSLNNYFLSNDLKSACKLLVNVSHPDFLNTETIVRNKGYDDFWSEGTRIFITTFNDCCFKNSDELALCMYSTGTGNTLYKTSDYSKMEKRANKGDNLFVLRTAGLRLQGYTSRDGVFANIPRDYPLAHAQLTLLLQTDKDNLRLKIASFFLGIIKKDSAISTNNIELFKEASTLFENAYKVNYQNWQKSTAPEPKDQSIFDLLQFALMSELIECNSLYNLKKTVDQTSQSYYEKAVSYYLNFPQQRSKDDYEH